MDLQELKEALNKFFGDKSRTRQQTADGLIELRDEIDIMLEALEDK